MASDLAGGAADIVFGMLEEILGRDRIAAEGGIPGQPLVAGDPLRRGDPVGPGRGRGLKVENPPKRRGWRGRPPPAARLRGCDHGKDLLRVGRSPRR